MKGSQAGNFRAVPGSVGRIFYFRVVMGLRGWDFRVFNALGGGAFVPFVVAIS